MRGADKWETVSEASTSADGGRVHLHAWWRYTADTGPDASPLLGSTILLWMTCVYSETPPMSGTTKLSRWSRVSSVVLPPVFRCPSSLYWKYFRLRGSGSWSPRASAVSSDENQPLGAVRGQNVSLYLFCIWGCVSCFGPGIHSPRWIASGFESHTLHRFLCCIS